MPIYEYLCLSCGVKFSKLVSLHNTDEVYCPQCQGKELQRLFSPVASRIGSSCPSSLGCGGGGFS